jgi:hypothetical protein
MRVPTVTQGSQGVLRDGVDKIRKDAAAVMFADVFVAVE